jgi:NAD(P)-dependent dehydrogenase (short-subunit alcohol dehydrogenase family)
MLDELAGKVALVTGGGSGIGRAAAIRFGKAGAIVVVADRNAAAAELTVLEIIQAKGEAFALEVDVGNERQVAEMVATIARRHDRLDCAFNNAGVIEAFGTRLADATVEDWDRVMGVNLKGVWICMKHEIRQMLLQGGGSIVNTASAVGLRGSPGAAIYCASKHGVIGLTQSAALQYAKDGIRVNAVCPGVIRTAMVEEMSRSDPAYESSRSAFIPMGRFGAPDEIAQAVVWLCSGAASYANGLAMNIDGGWLAR